MIDLALGFVGIARLSSFERTGTWFFEMQIPDCRLQMEFDEPALDSQPSAPRIPGPVAQLVRAHA